jgi:hypothetical protein
MSVIKSQLHVTGLAVYAWGLLALHMMLWFVGVEFQTKQFERTSEDAYRNRVWWSLPFVYERKWMLFEDTLRSVMQLKIAMKVLLSSPISWCSYVRISVNNSIWAAAIKHQSKHNDNEHFTVFIMCSCMGNFNLMFKFQERGWPLELQSSPHTWEKGKLDDPAKRN